MPNGRLHKRTQDELGAVVKKALDEKVDELLEMEYPIGERKPGMHARSGKVPYTRKYLEENFPKATFTPDENIPITWNGVRYDLFADREMTVPEPIKQVWDDYKKAKRRAGKGVMTSMGFVPVIGQGGLEEE